MKKSKELIAISLIILIAVFLRLQNLMFDAPYFFNPDERNMANAITQLRFPQNLNPHFFAYGQFPLYLAFLSNQLHQFMIEHKLELISFSSAIFWLRLYSALASVLTVLIAYLLSKYIMEIKFTLLAALLTTFIPGLIQASHFGTTESILTLFFLTCVYLSLKILRKENVRKNIFFVCFVTGLSIGTKLTGLLCLAPPFIALLILYIQKIKIGKGSIIKISAKYILTVLVMLVGSTLIGILSSPYNLLSFSEFQSAVFGYEQDVATGIYKAFYTVQFENSLPFIFQIQKVFPYALGLPLFISGVMGLIVMVVNVIKKGQRESYILILGSFFIFLIPNALLFVKWTRFMTPVFPFFAIFTAFLISKLYTKKQSSVLIKILTVCLVLACILPGIAFSKIYWTSDSRVEASKWINKNIPKGSVILSEAGNVIDIPLPLANTQNNNYQIISFDFYHIDKNQELVGLLPVHLEKSNYIFVPSRRVFANYAILPEKYPLLSKYYESLESGELGFEKINEITSYPSIGLIEFPDENAEETWTVFDHPVIRIYKKITPLSFAEYKSLLQ